METTRSKRIPKYRRHKPSGLAVVTIGGRDHYLGPWNTAPSKAEYHRLIAEYAAAPSFACPAARATEPGEGITVNELAAAYLAHAKSYYVKDGKPTSEVESVRSALAFLCKPYGQTSASAFGPIALKAVRENMVRAGHCRRTVNKQVGRIRRAFRFAVENEAVHPSTLHGLQAVAGLRAGRTEARDLPPVRPVDEADVQAILPKLSPAVAAMVQLQALTGMRPGEVIKLRGRDLDRSAAVWIYRPSSHKTQHLGRSREIPLGPKAQALLAPFLAADPDAHLFSPRKVVTEHLAERRSARVTPLFPSHVRRLRAQQRRLPKRPPRSTYSTTSYGHAVRKACREAGVPIFGPNRLRHLAATKLRRIYGIEVARVILGHTTALTTEIYAETDRARALAVMGEVG